ncbi:MAG: EamA family transporter [Kiloniellales bacterium]
MNSALWGLMAALSWGSADFIARFTGRALGPLSALLAMLSVGAVVMTGALWWRGLAVVWTLPGALLLIAAGVGTMVATLLLYWGLARGPVTVVAPIVGGYPALNVAFAVLLGVRPDAIEWAAMAAVLLGGLVVARSAGAFEESGAYSREGLRKTLLIALAAAFGFAATVAAAQEAIPYFGELETVALSRWVSVAACLVLFAVRRERPGVPARWWPLLALQGLLDAAAYVTLLLGSVGEGKAIAVVVASGFGAVTVILARIFLREAMTVTQWLGIALIVGGVAVLAGQG